MNEIYDIQRYEQKTAGFDWTKIPLMLTAWSGTPVFKAYHKTISEIVAAGCTERGSSLPITYQHVHNDGTAQTNQVLIPKVPIGAPITFFTMSKRTVPHQAAELILFLDDVYLLPFIANGLDLIVTPDWLQNRGWFR